MAEHPAWAVWLSDPKLAQLTLAGPKMPGSPYNVDDIRRPQPRHVATGTACSATRPADAEVLFDGTDLSKWTGDHFEEWTVHDGVVTTGARVYNFLKTKASYGDAQIHVEFASPPSPIRPPIRNIGAIAAYSRWACTKCRSWTITRTRPIPTVWWLDLFPISATGECGTARGCLAML